MQNLNTIKEDALTHFHELGFPTNNQENWQFTNLNDLQKMTFKNPSKINGKTIPDDLVSFNDTINYSIINGYPQSEFNSDEFSSKIFIGNFSSLNINMLEKKKIEISNIFNYRQHPFVAQNTGNMENGIYVYIPDFVKIKEPIHLLWTLNSDQIIQVFPRVYIHCGKSAEITVIEHFISVLDTPAFTNAVTEIIMDEDANMEYIRIQNEGKTTNHISALGVRQDTNSRFRGHTLTLGSKLTRNDVDIQLNGKGADCNLNGLYTMLDRQHVDNHTIIRHNASHTTSNENYKGILTDNAQGVFNGKIIVEKKAVKTDAVQSNRNILLSNSAGINSNPCLEIYTDDVSCKHGSTTGQLDEDAIYYLLSRGIDRIQAQRLLINGFATEILDEIIHHSSKMYLNNKLKNWLNSINQIN